jgi:Xaa-Pro dipeptidase
MSVPHLPPLTYGPGAVDWQERIDTAELRRQRAARARQIFGAHGVAVALVAGAPACRYLTGLKGQEVVPDSWYVLFPAEQEPVVFQQAGYVSTMAREAPWIKEWRFARSLLRGLPGADACAEEAGKFAADIRAELERLKLVGEKLAVVGIGTAFRSALVDSGVEVVDGEQLLLEAMAVKTVEELKCLRMAGAITDRMWDAMTRACHIGISDHELAAVGKAAGVSGGADSVNAVFRSGPLTSERGFKGGNQFIVPGDLMYGLVCGTSYLGYRTCVYRTYVVGREPTAEELGWMDRLQERLLAVISELKPGNLTSDAARHFPPAETWGYDDEVQVLTAEVGHGIGLHAYEQPVVNRQWSLNHPQELKAGMVVAVEGREGVIGQSTVRLEQMVVITEEGPQLIDRYPTGITVVG